MNLRDQHFPWNEYNRKSGCQLCPFCADKPEIRPCRPLGILFGSQCIFSEDQYPAQVWFGDHEILFFSLFTNPVFEAWFE